jgi:predicted dehydrogenase
MPTIIRKLVTQPPTLQLNVAIIGLGHQAVEEHLPAVLASDNYRLVALCDVDEQKLIPLRQKYGSSIGYHNDVEKMLQSCQLDLVIVAVPHHQYGPIIRACASYKVHILKEKPFARNMEEALKLYLLQWHVHILWYCSKAPE